MIFPYSSSGGLSTILTPNDEAQFWADEANTNKKRDVRDCAAAFYAALEPMKIEFEKLDTTLQLSEGEEVLEVVHNALDDLWKIDEWEYPQNRMVHLMDVLANSITRFIQSKVGSIGKVQFFKFNSVLVTRWRFMIVLNV